MAITKHDSKKAKRIHNYVQGIVHRGGTDENIMQDMADYMADFKYLMDNLSVQDRDKLFEHYEGYLRFGKILENLARGIESGDIKVP